MNDYLAMAVGLVLTLIVPWTVLLSCSLLEC